MKTQSKMMTIAAAAVLMSAAGTVHATGPRLVFEKPMTLKAAQVGVKATKVNLRFDRSANKWQESEATDYNHKCDVRINLEGRDIAVNNRALGEHYFGSMDLSCDGGDGFWSRSFHTKFSRVFFLGIRNCVQSETMIDQDYCTIQAVALRKDADLRGGADLFEDTSTRRTFARVHSQAAKTWFDGKRLAPEGLNMATIDSYQIFEVSIGRSGREFFIQNPGETSNFASGRNHYLSIADGSADRDTELKTRVERSLEEIDGMIVAIEEAARPKEVFDSKLGEIMSRFSVSAKDMLAIISPVEFFHLEKRLLGMEGTLVKMAKSFYPSITDRDSFVREYGAKFQAYRDVADYLRPNLPQPLPQLASWRPQDPRIEALMADQLNAGSMLILNADVLIPAGSERSALLVSEEGLICDVSAKSTDRHMGRVIPAGRRLEISSGTVGGGSYNSYYYYAFRIAGDPTIATFNCRSVKPMLVRDLRRAIKDVAELETKAFAPGMIVLD